jgi:uncharacterized protein
VRKQLLLLFSLLISINSYGEVKLDFSSDTFCDQSPKVQVRNNLFYLPNTQKPYSGENICVYSLNGQYHSKGRIINGLREGAWSLWYENGQLAAEMNYKNGKLDGKYSVWNESGLITNEYLLEDDEEISSKTITYHKNNFKREERNWKDGKLDGNITAWDKDGKKILKRKYKDGVCISGDCPD